MSFGTFFAKNIPVNMQSSKSVPTTLAILRRKPSSASYKVCPLCDGLNLKSNDCCYVCSWAGEFDSGHAIVNQKLLSLLHECPELSPYLLEPKRSPFAVRIGVVWRAIKDLFRRPVDYRA